MRQTTKQLFRKTKRGEFTDALAVVMFFFAVSIVWQVFLHNQKAINIKDDIDKTINEYVLCLEADGYLSNENYTALIADLAQLGMTDIDLSGTDDATSPKAYGQRVTLQVRGKLEMQTFHVSWLRLERRTTTVDINEKRVSVSHGLS